MTSAVDVCGCGPASASAARAIWSSTSAKVIVACAIGSSEIEPGCGERRMSCSGGDVRVSVVMPFRNEAAHLAEQLTALAAQDFTESWELIGVDDGSTDNSAVLVTGAIADHGWIGRVVQGPGLGPGPARNRGVAASAGQLICFCDADDVADPRWLSSLVRAARGGADIVAGHLERRSLNTEEQRRSRGRAGEARLASSCNMAIWRDTFDALAGFDVRFRQAEDSDLSLRALEAGYEIAVAPEAIVHYRYRSSMRRSLRQGLRTGYYRRMLRDRHRALVESESIWFQWSWLLLRLPTIFHRGRRRLLVVRFAAAAGEIWYLVGHLARHGRPRHGSMSPGGR